MILSCAPVSISVNKVSQDRIEIGITAGDSTAKTWLKCRDEHPTITYLQVRHSVVGLLPTQWGRDGFRIEWGAEGHAFKLRVWNMRSETLTAKVVIWALRAFRALGTDPTIPLQFEENSLEMETVGNWRWRI